MLKEIFEQPESLQNAMRGRLCRDEATAVFGGLNLSPQQLRSINRIRAHRLRHELACGPGRRISDRGIRPDSGRSRIRQRAALSQSADGSRHAAVRDHAKRRDGRHAGRPARDQAQRASDAGDLQRRRQLDRAGVRRRDLSSRRAGNRRRLDEGVYVAMRRAGDAGPVFRPAAAFELRRRAADHRRLAAIARPGSAGAEDERRSPPHRREVCPLQ